MQKDHGTGLGAKCQTRSPRSSIPLLQPFPRRRGFWRSFCRIETAHLQDLQPSPIDIQAALSFKSAAKGTKAAHPITINIIAVLKSTLATKSVPRPHKAFQATTASYKVVLNWEPTVLVQSYRFSRAAKAKLFEKRILLKSALAAKSFPPKAFQATKMELRVVFNLVSQN